MSMSPYFFIEVYNHKNGKWEKFDVYVKNRDGEIKPADLWTWNGTHQLFTILEFEDSYMVPDFTALHYDLPQDCSKEMKEIYKSHCWDVDPEGNFFYTPKVHWFNLADALLYLKEYPVIEDEEKMYAYYDENEGNISWESVPKEYTSNPLESLTDRVKGFLAVGFEDWYFNTSDSDVRVICWINR